MSCNIKKHRYGSFYVETKLHIPTESGISTKLFEPASMIDTGVTVTSLFPDKIWNYNDKNFFETLPREFFGYNYKEELEYLKNNISKMVDDSIVTGGGSVDKVLLSFKTPIYVGIEHLDPVPIYYLVVSSEKQEEELPILIGLDVLCQYDLNLTDINGVPIMTIKDKVKNNNENKKTF